jgi:hypothetical protein
MRCSRWMHQPAFTRGWRPDLSQIQNARVGRNVCRGPRVCDYWRSYLERVRGCGLGDTSDSCSSLRCSHPGSLGVGPKLRASHLQHQWRGEAQEQERRQIHHGGTRTFRVLKYYGILFYAMLYLTSNLHLRPRHPSRLKQPTTDISALPRWVHGYCGKRPRKPLYTKLRSF